MFGHDGGFGSGKGKRGCKREGTLEVVKNFFCLCNDWSVSVFRFNCPSSSSPFPALGQDLGRDGGR